MAAINNNATIIRRDLLVRLCKALLNETPEESDRIPLHLKPKNKGSLRCCIHKDRAVLKYKLMSLVGYRESDETDELIPISHYVKNPRGNQDFIIDVISEVCSHCPSSKYVVSNFCRACEARPCQVNCPKNAVNFASGRAEIEEDLCVNCGKCAKVCPYNAIQYQARPCEESCPVGAIYQNEEGVELIDEAKCILCGNCMQACPFGAITPSTTLPQIISEIKAGNQLVAMVAPSIDGQFRQELDQIYGSIMALGFTDLYPVALGADLTAAHESIELQEHIQNKVPNPLTSSCCPAWVKLVKTQKSFDDNIISNTPSPLAYTAEKVKQEYPQAKTVFFAPCIAKKAEAQALSNCDYCISFEELGAWLVASGIEISDQKEYTPETYASVLGKNFAMAGGVSQAIKASVDTDYRIENIHGLNKANIRLIKQKLKSHSCDFMEIMSCEEGCLGGNLSLVSVKESMRIFNGKAKIPVEVEL